ncbi:MAG: DNA-directed RNA polymerase subunit alpha [Ureaplasma sp.]|nr:DNA-directed RNA polymerase subunit alpha [Ureaplasma sp.]
MDKFLRYKIEPKFIDKTENKAIVVLEQLEKGFGQTLGNSLRRICLSSIPGVSMFAIKIPGVSHEYGPINGVEEDVTKIILNLKKLVIKFKGDESDMEKLGATPLESWPTLKIKVSGPANITAADIVCPEQFEVLNKDLHIATLTSKVKFELDIYARIGRGFVSFTENKEYLNVLSIIPTDSSFSPIIGFNYEVEEVKTSKISTSDKLTLTVATNGTITAADAIAKSAKILAAHLEPLISISEKIREQQVFKELQEATITVSLTPIEDLEFSVRAYNALKAEGVHSIQDLLEKTKDDIAKIKNLGRKSVQEIIDTVHNRGLKLKDEK